MNSLNLALLPLRLTPIFHSADPLSAFNFSLKHSGLSNKIINSMNYRSLPPLNQLELLADQSKCGIKIYRWAHNSIKEELSQNQSEKTTLLYFCLWQDLNGSELISSLAMDEVEEEEECCSIFSKRADMLFFDTNINNNNQESSTSSSGSGNLQEFSHNNNSAPAAAPAVREQPKTATPIQESKEQIEFEPSSKVSGILKFFYPNENYGFLVGDQDGCDIFFHIDDLVSKNITKDYLAQVARDSRIQIRFLYSKLAYFGKYGLSMKAVNIEVIEIFQTKTLTVEDIIRFAYQEMGTTQQQYNVWPRHF